MTVTVCVAVIMLGFISHKVTDADSNINSEVDFILQQNATSLFSLTSIGPLSTRLSIAHTLDREAVGFYSFSLFARDRGTPQQTGQTLISITILVSEDQSTITCYIIIMTNSTLLGCER